MKEEPYVVLVGMDFSELADRALVEAFKVVAFRKNAELHVVNVLNSPNVTAHPSTDSFYSPMDDMAPRERAFERLRAHVEARLEMFVPESSAGRQPFPVRVLSHVSTDSPGLGIAQLASDLNANLIVVGTHGRRGLARLVTGSFAETTMRHAHCPVLIVPPLERPDCSEGVGAA